MEEKKYDQVLVQALMNMTAGQRILMQEDWSGSKEEYEEFLKALEACNQCLLKELPNHKTNLMGKKYNQKVQSMINDYVNRLKKKYPNKDITRTSIYGDAGFGEDGNGVSRHLYNENDRGNIKYRDIIHRLVFLLEMSYLEAEEFTLMVGQPFYLQTVHDNVLVNCLRNGIWNSKAVNDKLRAHKEKPLFLNSVDED